MRGYGPSGHFQGSGSVSLNAFVQILRQLFEAVAAESWKDLAYFPFDLVETDESQLHDLALFHQSAREAYGIAWISFERFDSLLIFPFCMVRYQADEALITLPPWSIRDARADEVFYQHMRAALRRSVSMSTMLGNMLTLKSHVGEPALTAVSIDHDASHLLVRVDALEAYKFFRTTHRFHPHSREVEILEYLSQVPDFNGTARLVSSLEYQSADGVAHLTAVSMTYVQNQGNLWNHLLVHLQQARYPRAGAPGAANRHWEICLETTQRAGRLVADFHRCMMKAKRPSSIVPLSPNPEDVEQWKEALLEHQRDLVERVLSMSLSKRAGALHKDCMVQIARISKSIEKELASIESLGLLIQTHGHLHLGQILVGNDKLTLLDFQSNYANADAFERVRQNCFDDYVALYISLQFAWALSTQGKDSMVFGDILDNHSEYGAYLYERKAESERATAEESFPAMVPLSNATGLSEVSLETVHSMYSKAYFRALKDDPLTSELFPAGSGEFESLLRVYMFQRLLKELYANGEPGNPKAAVIVHMMSQLESYSGS